jgi:hypothetical protein
MSSPYLSSSLNRTIRDFEYNLRGKELSLNEASIFPVAQQITGPLKVLLGIIQVIVSLVVGVFAALLFVPCKAAREILAKAVEHFAHGLVNIFTGALFTVPLLGSLAAYSATYKNHMNYFSNHFWAYNNS